MLVVFLKADLSFQTTQRKSVAHILVSLNIRTDLREHINLIWGNDIKRKILNYEGNPFQCHATRRLAKNCHLGFTKNQARKRWIPTDEVAKEDGRSKQGRKVDGSIRLEDEPPQAPLYTEQLS